MKKLLLLLSFVTMLSCSKSDDETSTQSSNKDNFIELNGAKYYFDKVKLSRDVSDNVSFVIDMQDTPLTNRLIVGIGYLKSNSVPADTYRDIISTTYSYNGSNPYFTYFSLRKYKSDGTYITLTNDSDFIGKQSRVIVTKNSDTNFTFGFNFITTLGTIYGNYSGEVEKIGF